MGRSHSWNRGRQKCFQNFNMLTNRKEISRNNSIRIDLKEIEVSIRRSRLTWLRIGNIREPPGQSHRVSYFFKNHHGNQLPQTSYTSWLITFAVTQITFIYGQHKRKAYNFGAEMVSWNVRQFHKHYISPVRPQRSKS